MNAWQETKRTFPSPVNDTVARFYALRKSPAFRILPIDCVEEASHRARRVSVSKGQAIVRQGEPGNAFYVIESGKAGVWQTGTLEEAEKKVAERGEGEIFGEDALVLGGARNATVRMLTDGTLLVMLKADFDELIRGSMIKRVDAPVAKALLNGHHLALDVGCKDEYTECHLLGHFITHIFSVDSRAERRVREQNPEHVAIQSKAFSSRGNHHAFG